MEPQNPEDRIAELERQLAEQKRMPELKRQQAGPVNSPVVTPDDIHNVAFSKPPIGKRGYNEDEVDAFLDRVAAALVGPREPDTFGMRVNEESAVSGEPIRDELHVTSPKPGRWKASDGKWYAPQPENRCLLMAIPSWWKRQPSLAVEVDKDALRVFDPNSNVLITSASPSQVTATPAKFRESMASDWGGMSVRTRPVLVLGVPGLQPLIIGCPWHGLKLRFAWRGQVGEAKRPRYVVTDADWPILVEKLGLAPYLEDGPEYNAEGSW
jgi:DivIVA domain-containing protein